MGVEEGAGARHYECGPNHCVPRVGVRDRVRYRVRTRFRARVGIRSRLALRFASEPRLRLGKGH